MTSAISSVGAEQNIKSIGMSEEKKKKIDDKIKDFQDIPDTFEKGGKVLNDTLDTVNDTLKDTTGKTASLGITVAGLVTTMKKPFTTLIDWMKLPLKDENGEIVKEVLENGKEVIKKSEKFAKNKVIGVAAAGAIALASIVTAGIVKYVKNKKAQEVQANEEAKIETEPQVNEFDETTEEVA